MVNFVFYILIFEVPEVARNLAVIHFGETERSHDVLLKLKRLFDVKTAARNRVDEVLAVASFVRSLSLQERLVQILLLVCLLRAVPCRNSAQLLVHRIGFDHLAVVYFIKGPISWSAIPLRIFVLVELMEFINIFDAAFFHNQMLELLALDESFEIESFVDREFVLSQAVVEAALLSRFSQHLSLVDASQFSGSCIFSSGHGQLVREATLVVRMLSCLAVDLARQLHAVVDVAYRVEIPEHATGLHLAVEASWVATLVIKLVQLVCLIFKLGGCLRDVLLVFDRV